MRACSVTNAVTLGLFAVVACFSACAGGQTAPAPSPNPPGLGTGTVENPGAITGALTNTAPLVEAPKKPPPQSVADCKQVLSEIVNVPPPGGVVMNNAMTAGDAGSSDRFQSTTDVIKSRNDAFRCCFDLWARKHTEAAGREVPIKLVINLKPDGTLVSSSIDPSASQLDDPEVVSCMVDLTKEITYPKSPKGMDTKFTYTFFFKIRH